MRSLLSVFLVLTMIFVYQGCAFAADTPPQFFQVASQGEVIRLAENPQLSRLNTGLQFEATGLGGVTVEPWFWLLSTVVPGLGQVLMGEVGKGVLFFLGTALVWLVSAFLAIGATFLISMFGGSEQDEAAVTGIALFSLLSALAMYGWNIVDAYWTHQELMEPPLTARFEPRPLLTF